MHGLIIVTMIALIALVGVSIGVVNYGTYNVPRVDLGEAIHEYRLGADDFVALSMLPTLGLPRQSAKLSRVIRESLLERADVKRATNGSYNRADFQVEDVDYATTERGLEGRLGDDDRSKFASDFDAELETAQTVEARLLREQEIRTMDLLFNTTTWTGSDLYTDNSGAPWDAAGSDAIGHVQAAKEKVRRMTGMDPGTLLIGKVTWDNLKANTEILDRIKGVVIVTQDVLRQTIAGILGVDRILVGQGVYNSAAEGGTISVTDIWADDYAMVAVTASGNRITEPCLGRTILWTGDSPENTTVEEYREEQTRSNVFRIRHHVEEKILDAYFAHLMKVDA